MVGLLPKYVINTRWAAAACGDAPFGARAFHSYSWYSPVIPTTADSRVYECKADEGFGVSLSDSGCRPGDCAHRVRVPPGDDRGVSPGRAPAAGNAAIRIALTTNMNNTCRLLLGMIPSLS